MAEDHNGDEASAPFHRLLAHNGDVLGAIGGFLLWRDLLHVTSVSRVAFTSDLRREFERQSRLLLPPDPELSTTIASRFAGSTHEWSTIFLAHTALIDAICGAFSTASRVVVEPHRFMLPPSFASVATDLSTIHGWFPRLEGLDVSGIQELRDITPLAALTQLRRLNLSATGVQDLSAVSRLHHLHTLDISKTQITTLEPLRGLQELATLNLDEMRQLCSLEPLEDLPSLASLTVRQVKCEDGMEQLKAIAPRLHEFACCSKLLQSTRANQRYQVFGQLLRSLIAIESLEITSNATIYIQFENFVSLTTVRRLHASVLPTSDLSALSLLVHLEELSISSSKCVDLSPLASLRELKDLYCHGGDPDSMDSTTATCLGLEFPNLEKLDVSNHYLVRFMSLPRLQDLKVYVWWGDTLMLPIGCAQELLRFRLSGDMNLREIHAHFPNLQELELQQCLSYDPHDLVLFEKLHSLTLKDPATNCVVPGHPLPQLRALRLHGANIKHDPHLRSVPNLTHLELEKTSIEYLDRIKRLKKLQYLNLKDTKVRDLSPLLSLKSLEKVVLPKSALCGPLVDAYHDASSSLQLREVLHPMKNCLWGPHFRSRRKSTREPPEIEDVSPHIAEDAGDSLVQAISKCSIA